MSGLTIFHNPRCSKSKCALDFLEEQRKQEGFHLEVVQYQKDPPSRQVIQQLADFLGLTAKDELTKPWDLLMRPEAKNKVNSWNDAYDLLEKNPALLERPFVIDWDQRKAALGRPELSAIQELVEEHQKLTK
ncbi:thioredoxin-like protein [Radiomyces spectabilis]|uniref:thioredoxin-like protein n=1 Tax=Radiomyces spectabilis TaxID=64574 RepID=UPI002220867C|nr:thioredoxin-like protein [Radiomyces spectabilis]KAI8379435.1 thioredoxin-like protein [Radiomyces spectabilis]